MIPVKKFPWIWIFLLLSLEISAWMFDKVAILHASGSGFDFYISLISKPWIWCSILQRPLWFFIWNHILRNADLSKAYPITSLSYPLTMFAAQFFFHETPSLTVWIGGMLIALGVGVLGCEKDKSQASVEILNP